MTHPKLFALTLYAALGAFGAAGQTEGAPVPDVVFPVRIVGLEYPRTAHLASVQGSVELQALVDTEGAVVAVKPISGHSLLIGAATESLSRWRYRG